VSADATQVRSDEVLMKALLALLLGALTWGIGQSSQLPETLERVKPGVIAVGTFMALRQQQDLLRGTGFVVAGGNHAITNSHVVPRQLDRGRREAVAVYLPDRDNRVRRRLAEVIQRDIVHDLCLLRFQGPALRPLSLGRNRDVREGQVHAFTGFPILHALWLYPVTHQGIVSSVAPIAFPPDFGGAVDEALLRKTIRPFNAFRLDATAYPGNSGSPVYQPQTGRVIGVINSVQALDGRDSAIEDPSGTSFAIPVDYVRKLLSVARVKQ
jgi:S1-C subfamily serine protease